MEMTFRYSFNDWGFGFLGMVVLIFLFTVSGVIVVRTMAPTTSTEQNKDTTAKSVALRAALAAYKKSHGGVIPGTYPPNLDALVTTDGTPCVAHNNPLNLNTFHTLQGWCGPYLDRIFFENSSDFKTDGWGTAFEYNPATGALVSCGTDRTCGNADDINFP